MRNLREDSGRSMTEMLGTLAIIGVLSVGAIAGYSYGMDKYRANQTINDVMLRAVDVMTQLSQGKEPNLEPEWGTKGTVYDMEAIKDETNNTWGIVVDGVPSRVCQMVGDALKTQATVYVGNTERGDSADNDPCESSDNNTMEFYFESITTKFGECKTDIDCGSGRYCDVETGICFIGDKPIGSYGGCATDACCGSESSPYEKHGDDCSTDTITNGICYYGECVARGCTYDENKCTGELEYCASPNASHTEAFPSGKTGTCMKANFTKFDMDGKTYYVSYNNMSWWDADAACKVLGSNGLIGFTDIVDSQIVGLGVSYELTGLGEALKSYLGIDWDWRVWTSDVEDSNVKYLDMIDGSMAVGFYERNSSRGLAMCAPK